ncbi:hypothetical protein ACOSQ3_024504 [Xanthoceras sorbifolium]
MFLPSNTGVEGGGEGFGTRTNDHPQAGPFSADDILVRTVAWEFLLKDRVGAEQGFLGSLERQVCSFMDFPILAEKLALSSEKAKAISSFTACLDESYRVKDEMGDKLSSVELQRQELQSKVLEAAILKNERIGEETVAKNKKLWGPMQGKDYTVIVSATMKTLPHLTMEV